MKRKAGFFLIKPKFPSKPRICQKISQIFLKVARSKKQNPWWEVGKLSFLSAAIHLRRHRHGGSWICILVKKNMINYTNYPKTSSQEANKHFEKSFMYSLKVPQVFKTTKKRVLST